jgi:antitoxin (DNA-binding transcriptional repressor) of toxin-antitoxin stability system
MIHRSQEMLKRKECTARTGPQLSLGWEFDTVRLLVVALARAGKIEATSKGQTIESALSIDARNTFENNNLFRQTSFRPNAGRTLRQTRLTTIGRATLCPSLHWHSARTDARPPGMFQGVARVVKQTRHATMDHRDRNHVNCVGQNANNERRSMYNQRGVSLTGVERRTNNMHAVTIEEAQARLPELVSTLVPGEEVPITREGHLVATLVAPPRASWPCQPGTAKGILNILSDDDDHLADFREYIE